MKEHRIRTNGPDRGRYRTVVRPHRPRSLVDTVGRVIAFFREDAPIPIVINRVKLAVCLVIGVFTPAVLVLSALVFSSRRRWR